LILTKTWEEVCDKSQPQGAYWGPEVVTVGETKHDEPVALENRVHVDLPRVRPEDMVTTQAVEPPRDPEGGRSTDMEFMTRNGGW